MGQFTNRVQRGITFLDGREPGWVDKIDLEEFQISNCTRCVLGQVFGAYNSALSELGDAKPWDLGFALSNPDGDWDGLQAEWVKQIKLLKNPPSRIIETGELEIGRVCVREVVSV